RPPSVPQIGERQPRVLPTASTMVNASTHSTTLATNAGTAAMARVAKAAFMSANSLLINYYNVTAVTDHILEARWRQAAGVRSRVCSTCAWVGHVPQAIAEQVDRQHGAGDAQAGRDHLPRVVLEVACGF